MNKTLKDTYFLFVVLFSGLSTTFFRSHEGLIILFLVGVLIFGSTMLQPTKVLFYALGLWLAYFAINTIIIKSFHPFFLSTYIIYILIAWWLLSYYKERIFLKYENAIYVLSIISLVFYTWQIIDFNSLYSIIKPLDLSQGQFPKVGYASIVIYNIRELGMDTFHRNSGFTWEPGPFSSFLVIALFLNLARNRLIFKDKLRILIFLIAIITTQSTTGLLALLLILLWIVWVRFKNMYFKILSIPSAIIVVYLLFVNVPFLQQKIIKESEQELDVMLRNSIKYGGSYNPGRFVSFQLGWADFKNYPVAGIGGKTALRSATQQGAEVNTINGLAMIMTRYGSIGLIIFLYLIFATGKWLTNFYNISGILVFPLILLIISFAFGIIETPIIVILWMTPVFLAQTRQKNYVEKSPLFYRQLT